MDCSRRVTGLAISLNGEVAVEDTRRKSSESSSIGYCPERIALDTISSGSIGRHFYYFLSRSAHLHSHRTILGESPHLKCPSAPLQGVSKILSRLFYYRRAPISESDGSPVESVRSIRDTVDFRTPPLTRSYMEESPVIGYLPPPSDTAGHPPTLKDSKRWCPPFLAVGFSHAEQIEQSCSK